MFAALLGLALVGCDNLGAVEDMGDDDDDELPEGVACMATLSVTGTLTPPGTPPGPDDGCVPLGTWTVDIQMVDPGDCAEVPLRPQYVYEVTGSIDDGWTYTYVGDPTAEHVYMKVTQGGPGDCEANFEHYTPDGLSLTFSSRSNATWRCRAALSTRPTPSRPSTSRRRYFSRPTPQL